MGLWDEFIGVETEEEEEVSTTKYSDISKYYGLDKQQVRKTDFWTNQMYEKAYDVVKNRKAPVAIPSYNRPDNKFVRWIGDHITPETTWPIYLVVRESQKKMYEDSPYIKGRDYLHVLSFEDSRIDDIGKVRQTIVEHFTELGEPYVMMMDDDVIKWAYSVPYERSTGAKISLNLYEDRDFGRVMAMWQLATEYATAKEDNVILTCGMTQGFAWGEFFCREESSLGYLRGSHTLAVCMNLEAFKKYDINYRTIKGHGHDDVDFLIRALLKGAVVAEFRWVTYASSAIGTDIIKAASVEERFERQYQEMWNEYKDVPFVKWRHDRGKANVGIKWPQALNYFTSHGFRSFSKDNREVNIWRNGAILEEGKDGRIRKDSISC